MNAAWKTIRVFISSTFRDMQAERDWLVRFVFPRLKERLLKHRIHFVAVDLRWGVTGEEDAGEVCREVIGECRPRFIGMLGGRYGWVPPPKRIAADDFNALESGITRAGPLTDAQRKALHALYSPSESGGEFRFHEKPEATEGGRTYDADCKLILPVLQRAGLATSITADEIDFGVLNPPPNERGPVRAFFYFRDDAATNRMLEDKQGDYREPDDSDSARDLAALKQTIVDGGLPVFVYDAQWDATAKRLTGLKKFGNRVLCDLFKSIRTDPELAARFASKSDAETDPFVRECQDEADQMEAFIQERTDSYILGSRESLMNDLLAFAGTDGAPNILVLTGAPGSGKSALLAKFTREISKGRALSPLSAASNDRRVEDNAPYLLIPHFIGASTGSTDLRRTLRRVCHELTKVAGNTETLPLDIKELINHFQKLLTEAAGRQRIVLVFDALNQFDETDGAHWMNWLPRELPPSVRIIASVIAPAEGEKEHQTLATLRNRKDACVETLKPLNEADTLAIIQGYLKRYSKRLSAEQITALTEKPASNVPLYILTALEELRTIGTYERLCELASKPLFPAEELERLRREDHDAILARFIDVELPGTAVELFKWILQTRLSKDPILASHPHGARQLIEQFAACLGVSRHGLSPAELTALLDPGDPLGNVAALLRLLRPYLMRRGELLDFYHGQFREAAKDAYLDTPEKQRAAHQSVAICLQAFADPHRDGQCRDAAPHALSELPHHQTRAEAWPDLIATLENIFFLEAKVTHGMAFDLATDFTAAVHTLPVEHAERHRLRLLNEALHRDLHFIARHARDYPQALFQSLWNSGAWYDSPFGTDASTLREENGVSKRSTLLCLLRAWRLALTERFQPRNRLMLISALPPRFRLGSGEKMNFSGHRGIVLQAHFSPDESRILTIATDQKCCIWAVSGICLVVFDCHVDRVFCGAWSSNGEEVATGSADGQVFVWNASTGALNASFKCSSGVTAIMFSKVPGTIIVGTRANAIALYDYRTGEALAQGLGHGAVVASFVCPTAGDSLFSSGADGTIKMWRLHPFQFVNEIPLDNTKSSWLTLTGDDRDFVSAERLIDGRCQIVLRDGRDGRAVQTLVEIDDDPMLTAATLSQDRVLAYNRRNVIHLEAPGLAESRQLRGHTMTVLSLSFSRSQGTLLSAGGSEAKIWDITSPTDSRADSSSSPRIRKAVLRSDGAKVACIPNDTKEFMVRVWDVDKREWEAPLENHFGFPIKAIWGREPRQLITSHADSSVLIWNVQAGSSVEVEFDAVAESLCAGHHRRLACACDDGVVRVVDSYDGHLLAELAMGNPKTGDVRRTPDLPLAFSPASEFLACGFDEDQTAGISGGNSAEIFIWSMPTGRKVHVLRGHKGTVTSLAFDPAGRFLATGARDHMVILWDLKSGSVVKRFGGHTGAIHNLAFTPDGENLLSSQHILCEPMTKFWDIRNLKRRASWEGAFDVDALASTWRWNDLGKDHFFGRMMGNEFQVVGRPGTWELIATVPAQYGWRFTYEPARHAIIGCDFDHFYHYDVSAIR